MAKQAESDLTGNVPIALSLAERERIEADIQAYLDAAQAMIARLDLVDPDPDLEDDGTAELEPDGETNLGWPEMLNQSKAIRTCTNWEATQDLEQDRADDEPSLGWTISGALGDVADREQDCEDEGACEMAREDLW